MAEPGPLTGKVLQGKYLLGERLGKGGFAEVYKAENQLLKRPQAIKVLLEQYAHHPKFRERFVGEAQTLAALEHPHIVSIHEFGFEENRPFLVMPFISGGTLQGVIEEHQGPFSIEETCQYLVPICAGLQYAHTHNVIHLDLKPLNVLLHQDGRPLLSDFGLAHFLTQEGVKGGTSLQFGTPHYMSPEHWKGEPGQCSDLYALGVIAYQMLVGRLPFHASTPWAIGAKHATEHPPSLRGQVPSISPEIEEVVFVALAKDPRDRFVSVQAFAKAFEQANRMATAMIPPVHSPVLPGPFERTPFEPLLKPAGGFERPPRGVQHPDSTLPPPPIRRSSSSDDPVNGVFPSALHLPSGTSSRGNAALPFQTEAPPESVLVAFRGHAGPVQAIAWSPAGLRIASGSNDRTVQVWDSSSGRNVFTYQSHGDKINAVAWSPNGQQVASGGKDQTIQVWEAATRHELWDVTKQRRIVTYRGHQEWEICSIAWSPGGQFIASGDSAGRVQVWEVASGYRTLTYRGHPGGWVKALAWSPDGRQIASGWSGQAVQVWDAASGKRQATHRGHPGLLLTLIWSPDGKYLAAASQHGTVQVWDSTTGARLFSDQDLSRSVLSIAWSPDSKYLHIASGLFDVQVWDVLAYKLIRGSRGSRSEVFSLAWSPDLQRVASGNQDGKVLVWNAAQERRQFK